MHVKYLKGTINKGLFYSASCDLSLTVYSNADWGRCLSSRRSLTGYCIFLGESLVSWKIKKQKTVSKSLAESEYSSMFETTSELVWISRLLHDLQKPVQFPISLHCDNRAVQHIVENPVFDNRAKHLDLDCHYVQDKLLEGFLRTHHLRSSLQFADNMTKPLGTQQHQFFGSQVGTRRQSTKPNLKGGCRDKYLHSFIFVCAAQPVVYI